MDSFDIKAFRALFPILSSSNTIYFDNGATTHKPRSVIDAINMFYSEQNANVHRSSHRLGAQSTSQFEASRQRVARFINANNEKEIIWTKGTTEAINLVAATWGEVNIKAGDEIVLSQAEHHANIVPWQQLALRKRAKIIVMPLTSEGTVDIKAARKLITAKTKIVCCCHISNVIGKVNPIEGVIALARSVGAKVLIDGAQAIASIKVDVQKLDCDFYAFSAHKMYGPTGLGILFGKAELLESMPPYQLGGEMIKSVSFEQTTFNEIPFKFEAGTPNISAVVAMDAAIDLIEMYRLNSKHTYKQQLVDYTYHQLKKLPAINLLVQEKPDIPLFSFTGNFATKDLASALDAANIAVRSGYMCAMPLMEAFSIQGCIRVALAPYNTIEEVDRLVSVLEAFLQDEQANAAQNGQLTPAAIEPLSTNSDALVAQFSALKGWDSKHRQIMLFGKSFARMADEFKTPESLITGCESDAWLVGKLSSDNRLMLQADSQARVIRGLLHIVFAAYQDKTPNEILAFDIEHYFTQLGLIEHLSPSRGNGLKAIVTKIKRLANEYAS
ncbi:SufS family cysteine desulfurase [Thalassotalea fusca]